VFVEQLCFCFVQAPAYILNRVEKGDNYCKMLQRLVCLEFVVSNILHFSLLILYGTKTPEFFEASLGTQRKEMEEYWEEEVYEEVVGGGGRGPTVLGSFMGVDRLIITGFSSHHCTALGPLGRRRWGCEPVQWAK